MILVCCRHKASGWLLLCQGLEPRTGCSEADKPRWLYLQRCQGRGILHREAALRKPEQRLHSDDQLARVAMHALLQFSRGRIELVTG